MRVALAAVWAVILASGIIQLANALQTDLLSVRAGLEQWPALLIGAVMSSYYIGYSSGPLLSPRVIGRFGHVATILAGASVAGGAILLSGFLVSGGAWALLRIVSGLALSVTFVACESWINDRSENRVRGRVFGTYMVVQMAGMTPAQLLFAAGDPGTLALFALTAGIFALGGLPIFFAAAKAPLKAPPSPLGLIRLFRLSPLGATATVLAGISWSIVFTFGPVYAQRAGFGAGGVGLYMALAIVAGAVLQFPLGWISDLIGRRMTIGLMAACAVAASLFGYWANDQAMIFKEIAAAAIGGLVFPLYALSVAHTNDSVSPQARVPAAAGLVLIFGLGSIIGPIATGWFIAMLGPAGFFALLALVMAMGVTAAAATR